MHTKKNALASATILSIWYSENLHIILVLPTKRAHTPFIYFVISKIVKSENYLMLN